MKVMDYVWPIIGLGAVVLSAWLLYQELRGISFTDVIDSLAAIPAHNWLLAVAGAIVAYAALAWYDRIALLHLGRKIPWLFISIASFTTYALSHNIGASVFSGAVVRYRAYSSRGLSASEIGVLVAFCSFTFLLGTLLLGALVLIFDPYLVERLHKGTPLIVPVSIGLAMLALVATYVVGSWRGFKPLKIGSFAIHYPKTPVVIRQLLAAPVELMGAAAIIYFALPPDVGVSYFTVLGIFLASFSLALVSHAPGGLGVLEVVFVTAVPDLDKADVLAALIVFRLLYLLLPFAMSLVVVVLFERARFIGKTSGRLREKRQT
ncbi:lysylphosphatidylglycerol synthase transmembrane domain-containing protein [Hartmannibacter diazotrophicus]|nr:YbhN family protein [Hartmannibacter diazotrophicus]